MVMKFGRWLCLIILLGSCMAADVPFAFNASTTELASYTSDQLENLSAASPELAGVPPISNPSNNETLTFPIPRRGIQGCMVRTTVEQVRTSFNARSWQEKGAILLGQGRYDEALQAFDQVLRLDPANAETWNAKGSALFQMGRYSDAVRCFKTAIGLKPSFSDAWNNEAAALCAMGRYNEAMAACDRVLGLNPRNADAWAMRGQILLMEASAAFKKARDLGE